MHPTQLRYTVARAALDTANAEYKTRIEAAEAELSKLFGVGTDDWWLAWENADELLEDELGVESLFHDLRDAEDEMIAWAERELQSTGLWNELAGVAFERAPKSPRFRAKLVDICARFRASL